MVIHSNVFSPEFGHFTQMVKDDSSQFGCAASQYTRDNNHYWYICCIYSITNVIGQAIYQTGTPCSGCPNGCDSFFPALCAGNGLIGTGTGTGTGTGVGTGVGSGAGTGGNTSTPISTGSTGSINGNTGNISSPNILGILNSMLQNGNGQNLNRQATNTQIESPECKRKGCRKSKKAKKHNRKSNKPEISAIITFEPKRSNNVKIARTIF